MSSSNYTSQLISNTQSRNDQSVKMIHVENIFQVTVHAFLLWLSIGFLTPMGVLVMRMSSREQWRNRKKALFYLHVGLQVTSAILVTAAAILSIKVFENKFDNMHQRIGLAILGLIWFQLVIGAIRPHRGGQGRSSWYFVHWLLGTSLALLGIVNIYTGLFNYHIRTSNSVTNWVILFTIEIGCIAFIYLLQDKWDYIKMQSVLIHQAEIPRTSNSLPPLEVKANGSPFLVIAH